MYVWLNAFKPLFLVPVQASRIISGMAVLSLGAYWFRVREGGQHERYLSTPSFKPHFLMPAQPREIVSDIAVLAICNMWNKVQRGDPGEDRSRFTLPSTCRGQAKLKCFKPH